MWSPTETTSAGSTSCLIDSSREGMTPSEHASRRHEQSMTHQSVRFFKSIGIGLAVIGFGFCGVLYVLGAFAA